MERQGIDGAQETAQETAQESPGGKTFTQEDLDRLIQERLERERKKFADYEDLRRARAELEKLKESQMSELDKTRVALEEAQRLAAEKDAALKELELQHVRAKVCLDAGLDAAWADRLIGDDAAALQSDVEKLKKFFSRGAVGAPTNPENGGATVTVEGARWAAERNARGRTQNGAFSPWKNN